MTKIDKEDAVGQIRLTCPYMSVYVIDLCIVSHSLEFVIRRFYMSCLLCEGRVQAETSLEEHGMDSCTVKESKCVTERLVDRSFYSHITAVSHFFGVG